MNLNYDKIKKLDKFNLIIDKTGLYRFWFNLLKRLLFGECIYCGFKAPKFRLSHKH